MHQHSGRITYQGRQVASSIEIITVQHHKATRADLLAARPQGIAGAARHGLMDRQPFPKVFLALEVCLDLVGQIVNDHKDAIDNGRQCPEGPIKEGSAGHPEERFRCLQGVRP
jgi:hypothetical protein